MASSLWPAPEGALPLQDSAMLFYRYQPETLGERGGRRRDFDDAGVNTRQAMAHVKDSKTGTSGDRIQLTANFFRILSRPQWMLYQYRVDFNPFEVHKFDETVLHSETRDGVKVQITVTLMKELHPSSPVCIQFYNIIFSRILRILDMQQIERNFYNPNVDPNYSTSHSTGLYIYPACFILYSSTTELTIWPGYTATILHYETSIMLCADVSHRVLSSETVLDFMANMRQRVGDQRFPELCAKELVGLIVLTKYNNKTYRIDDIAWDQTPNNTFTRADEDISFKDYYKTQYNLDIADGNQVLLVSHVKKMVPSGQPPPGPAMLIPELCFLTGLTDEMRADYTIMKDLSKYTKLEPDVRETRLKRFVSNIQKNTDAQAELDQWGLRLDKLLNLTGRVLPPERIFQGGYPYVYDPKTADWYRKMRQRPVISAPPLDNWIMLYPQHNKLEAMTLRETLEKVTVTLHIRMESAVTIEYEDDQESLLTALDFNVKPETQMVVVVLSSDRKDVYDSVKKYLCVDCPTPSQCVVASSFGREMPHVTVATKIALQIACKMGGELWSVKVPHEQLMIVGIDVYHDTIAGNSSVGALVASLNQSMSRWYSKCVLQDKDQEIMDGLKLALCGALKGYLKFNNCLPAHIVYRDGVGDDKLHSVINYEVSQIIESIKSMGLGTIVDYEVTHREWYNFYIVSQAVRKGSVSPTHYNVVYDTSGLTPDHMQQLTYKLCHMYYWQGTIRVPAPCQYAHKLAYLVGESIHTEPSVELDNLLFYL
ncbi:hypothetical protein VZT92_018908 [Zoarces viviparus]|uniref:Piwi-like protein 1 n=1 Tax=Zoarces viviparus TaxID=48416 RepID=A0AAW1EI97_ZOAVI